MGQEFEKWYEENEIRFHQGQFSDRDIAYSAFNQGLSIGSGNDYHKNIDGLSKVNTIQKKTIEQLKKKCNTVTKQLDVTQDQLETFIGALGTKQIETLQKDLELNETLKCLLNLRETFQRTYQKDTEEAKAWSETVDLLRKHKIIK